MMGVLGHEEGGTDTKFDSIKLISKKEDGTEEGGLIIEDDE
jgi:hypothetical protein